MFIILAVFVFAVVILYRYLTFHFDYWSSRDVKGPQPSVLVGNLKDVFLLRRTLGQVVTSEYEKYPNEKCVGMFNGRKPSFMPRDLECIKHILIKDFGYFTNRGLSVSNDPLGENLFNSDGGTWRVLRQNLTPVFSSGKIKNMSYLINACANAFQKYIHEIVERNEEPEIRDLMGKYTLEVICSCAFGIEVEALKHGSNIFQDMGKKIFEPSLREFVLRTSEDLFPGILKVLNISVAKQEVVDFFHNLVKEVVAEREGKPKVRQDFMDLMLTLREKGQISGGKPNEEYGFNLDVTDSVMAAQAFIFFAAGFETSSGTMAFLLHELALNPDIQDRVRREINETVAKNGKLSYDSLHEMHYLEMVFSETLRKYPVGDILIRECVKKYNLPDTTITIDKGTLVMIPVMGIHRDPQYYPEPEKFDPERFSVENRRKRDPSAYIPFGDGPRNCIGLRFAKVQSMLGVAALLRKFRVEPTSRTRHRLDFHPRTFTLQSRDGIWLKISRL